MTRQPNETHMSTANMTISNARTRASVKDVKDTS